jgi:hypothetical protein
LEGWFFFGGGEGRTWHWALSFCELFFLPNLQHNIGKKYLKTAIIIDESLIHAIVSRNYSTKPSYIFQFKRELKVWKYIFNLFHFEVLIQNRNPKFQSLSLFVLTFHEYKARFVFGFRLDYKLSLFIFFMPPWRRVGGHINLPLSVCPSGYRYMVCPANSSYRFRATALIFCRMFIHIMELCMSTGFWFTSNILKMTGSWT